MEANQADGARTGCWVLRRWCWVPGTGKRQENRPQRRGWQGKWNLIRGRMMRCQPGPRGRRTFWMGLEAWELVRHPGHRRLTPIKCSAQKGRSVLLPPSVSKLGVYKVHYLCSLSANVQYMRTDGMGLESQTASRWSARGDRHSTNTDDGGAGNQETRGQAATNIRTAWISSQKHNVTITHIDMISKRAKPAKREGKKKETRQANNRQGHS